jgi:hypothetical protein
VALTFKLRQALPVFRYDHIDLSEPMAAASKACRRRSSSRVTQSQLASVTGPTFSTRTIKKVL